MCVASLIYGQQHNGRINVSRSLTGHNCKNQKCESLEDAIDSLNRTTCFAINCSLLKSPGSDGCNCKVSLKRLVDGKHYTLLNPCEHILLYRHEIRVGKMIQNDFYFGENLESPLVKLTKENLKNTFSDHPDFQKKIDQVFRRDGDLPRYDNASGEYLLNWLYSRSKS